MLDRNYNNKLYRFIKYFIHPDCNIIILHLPLLFISDYKKKENIYLIRNKVGNWQEANLISGLIFYLKTTRQYILACADWGDMLISQISSKKIICHVISLP